MSCEAGCYEFDIEVCDDPVITGLTASTLLKGYLYRPRSSTKYSFEVSTDADGTLTIDASMFPLGFFAGGFLNIELFKKDGDDNFTVIEQLPGTTLGSLYDCGLMHIVNITNVNPEA